MGTTAALKGIHILFMVVMMNPAGTPRPVTIVETFSSGERCLAALESVKTKLQNGRIDLATCEKQ